MQKQIDAVIFDLDGTLADSMWVWVKVDELFFERYNLTKPEGFHDGMEGLSFTDTAVYFKKIFPEISFLSVEDIKQIWYEMCDHLYETEVPLKKGAKDFLGELKRRGIKTGIATSNDRSLVDLVLKAKGIEDMIDAITTGCEVNASKPDPTVYLNVAQKLQVEPSNCIVFEDVPNGILAGKNAGMATFAIEDSFSAALRERKEELADYYIEDYLNITDILFEE